MKGRSNRPVQQATTTGAIRLDAVGLDYPLYKRLVWDRLREVAGAACAAWRPPVKPVLHDISLTVEPGEILSLLGHNGAGKTSLLKIVSRMMVPTRGHCVVGGKVMALLATGTGFRANFTGRENLYYGGLLLGLRRRQMDELIEEMADFAELGDALDQPYFTYSSGMRARLGFALATGVPADVVILDETLSTGDSRFVTRCYKRIREICDSGRTVLFVSHNLGEIARMTRRVIVLDHGRMVFDGATSDGIDRYEELLGRREDTDETQGIGKLDVRVELLDGDGTRTRRAFIGAPASLRLRIQSEHDLGRRFVQLRMLDDTTNQLVAYLMRDRFSALLKGFDRADYNIDIAAGQTEVVWPIPCWTVGEGRYQFDAFIGPPVEVRNTDVSNGRVWRSCLTVDSTYQNPFLKGAMTRLEMPLAPVEITHQGITKDYAETAS